MEPVFNNTPASPEPFTSPKPIPSPDTYVSVNDQAENRAEPIDQSYGDEDTNAQIVERLKEQRDELRGINDLDLEIKPKKSKLKIILGVIVFSILTATLYVLVVRPYLDKSDDIPVSTLQQNFVLPSNLASKTSEEKQALNIISLARQNKADEIINTYLNKARLGQSEADFKALVSSYSSSADGQQAELVEKTVGKVDFAATGESSAIPENTAEFEAASLIYKSGYFRHTNNLYLKINLYKPDPTVDAWKLYTFEFKAGDSTAPLKADINIPA